MPWRTITSANIQGRFTASEQAMLAAAAGSTNKLSERLADAVATFVGAMNAAGWDTNTNGSISDGERNCVMAYAVWEWLKDFPQLDKMKTKERQQAYNDAVTDLGKIRNRTYGAIEPPQGMDKSTGNWNSKPKLMMRTDPHPQPLDQLQLLPTPAYANPNAPTDEVPSESPGIPLPTTNLTAIANNGAILLYWNPVVGATGYAIYRSTTSGQEITGSNTPPLATVTSSQTNYLDSTVTSGKPFYYQISTLNGALFSGLSNEATATP